MKWSSFKESVTFTAAIALWIGAWIATALVALVSGVAAVKWAIEELEK